MHTNAVKRLPLWAWLVATLGAAMLITGGFLDDGSYLQSLSVELGATVLLVIPIVIAERSIVATLRKRMDDVAAINRTEEYVRVDEFVRHWGQALGHPRLPGTEPGHLERMLGAEGWTPLKLRDGYRLWSLAGRVFAVPTQPGPVGRGVMLGACRYVGWNTERYIELWNATRAQGVEVYAPPTDATG